jgi:uncharacterized membrane protein YkoI
MNKRNIVAIAVVIGLAAISAVVYAGMDKEENKQKVAMTQLPAAVQKTIQDNLGGGTVTETEKETKDGKTYYEVEVKKSGGDTVEIKVAEDGSLIGVGKEDDDD